MATPDQLRHELLDRLDRAGPNGVAQSLFLRTVTFALTGTPEAEVKAALDALRRSGEVKLVDGRWRRSRTDTSAPTTPEALDALSELRLSALAPGPITLRVEVEPGPEPDDTTLEANLEAALAAAPIGPNGERRLDIDAAMFERLRQGTVVTHHALPDAEQVEACVYLVENAAAVARTIGEVFAEEAGAPRHVRLAVATRAVLGDWEFAVAEVFVRAPIVGGAGRPTRSNVVLRGACGWDEEHRFAVELARGAVVMHGSWSCVSVL
jgi:hypothetical protein